MGFAIANMTWATKRATISHSDYSVCNHLAWRVGSVKCNTTVGHNHSPPAVAWVIGPSYTPTPIGAIAPGGMDSQLEFVPALISAANQQIYYNCFRAGVQMKLTVRFGDGVGEPLIINLSL